MSSSIEYVVHPTPLLSILDHHARLAEGTNRRVIGVLLGEDSLGDTRGQLTGVHLTDTRSRSIHVTNTFAIPFEENPKNNSVFYIDTTYLAKMNEMMRKINIRENIVGWYSTAQCSNDTLIHSMICSQNPNAVYLNIDLGMLEKSKSKMTSGSKGAITGQCVTAYQLGVDANNHPKFHPIEFSFGMQEAEEVAVEHILKFRDVDAGTLSCQTSSKVDALKFGASNMQRIATYCDDLAQKMAADEPISFEDNAILDQLQSLLNCLPDKVDSLGESLTKKTDEHLLAAYVGFSTRAIISLVDLAKNKKKFKTVVE